MMNVWKCVWNEDDDKLNYFMFYVCTSDSSVILLNTNAQTKDEYSKYFIKSCYNNAGENGSVIGKTRYLMMNCQKRISAKSNVINDRLN